MATPDSPAAAPRTSNINVRRGEPLVIVDHVDKHFGELHVLKDINTVVTRGEVVVVIDAGHGGERRRDVRWTHEREVRAQS